MKKQLLILGLVLVFFASCASGPTIANMESEITGFELPQNPTDANAMVYIIRPSAMGFAIKFKVYVDQKESDYFVGSTNGGQYIYFAVTPGSHVLLSQAENLAKCEFTAEASKIYFFEQIPRAGILIARNNLIATKDVQGKYYVKKLKLGDIKK